LADILVNYSVMVKKGEKVLIQDTNAEPEFGKALVRAVRARVPRGTEEMNMKALEAGIARAREIG
jgi:Pyruvate/2-oxoacid:ferredoxin oxidoreductase gamma subunit